MDLKQNIIGEIGEQLVVVELLKSGFKEVYRANSKTQKGWDIVVITEKNKIIRIQVKTTFLDNNTSTNNSFKVDAEAEYDFLVIVVIEQGEDRFFLLPKNKIEDVKAGKTNLSVTQKVNKKRQIKKCLLKYEVTGKEDWIEKLGIKDVI